jgi:hypothetical protein
LWRLIGKHIRRLAKSADPRKRPARVEWQATPGMHGGRAAVEAHLVDKVDARRLRPRRSRQ